MRVGELRLQGPVDLHDGPQDLDPKEIPRLAGDREPGLEGDVSPQARHRGFPRIGVAAPGALALPDKAEGGLQFGHDRGDAVVVVRGDLLAAVSIAQGRLDVLELLLGSPLLDLQFLDPVLVGVVLLPEHCRLLDARLTDLSEELGVALLEGEDLTAERIDLALGVGLHGLQLRGVGRAVGDGGAHRALLRMGRERRAAGAALVPGRPF